MIMQIIKNYINIVIYSCATFKNEKLQSWDVKSPVFLSGQAQIQWHKDEQPVYETLGNMYQSIW